MASPSWRPLPEREHPMHNNQFPGIEMTSPENAMGCKDSPDNIQQRMMVLDERLSYLGQAVSELENKLYPVLRREPSAGEDGHPGSDAKAMMDSELAEHIEGLSRRAADLTEYVERLRRQVQL